ncbi:hypothetical protein Pla108_21700 [Botrimarina colliarenosi]|uniref:Uncharacterized protein n=1 Tax=Botrimarina colliarenosi TaxID=2528001 RepID=A0A5C6AFP9_9BACT|nr:hypothetical protein [Botrimarina colliarenosi]TWT98015.1 hypothetical protein Pla108_21700 [Botrimarina colliarenosi]
MSETTELQAAELWVDRGARRYAPGELLTGGYRLAGWRDIELTAIELSVLWYTAGQGEEDFFVHHFERRREATLPVRRHETPHQFETFLPASPLSHDGQIVKVCWAVRLRGFFRGGRQRVIEAPFWLALPTDKPLPEAAGAEGASP